MKKQLIIAIAVLGISVIAMESCFKKGPGDPLISFRSRLERISGHWNCTKYEVNGGDSTTVKHGDTLIRCSLVPSSIHENDTSILHNFTFIFDHNGHYELDTSVVKTAHLMVTHSANCGDTTYALHNPAPYAEAGTWNFMGKVGQYKKYEAIVTYDQNLSGSGNIYHIYELKDKTMILERTVIPGIVNVTVGATTTISQTPPITYRWTLSKAK